MAILAVGLVPSGVCRRMATVPMGASGLTSISSVTWLRGGSGPRSTVEGVPFEPSRISGRSGSSLMRTMRALMPGSLKYTALVRARFRPSTFISTVAPRATPRGVTELMVGAARGQQFAVGRVRQLQDGILVRNQRIDQRATLGTERPDADGLVETTGRHEFPGRTERDGVQPILRLTHRV